MWKSRPKRTTAAVAKVKIRDIQQEDDDILSLIKMGGVLCRNLRDLETILI